MVKLNSPPAFPWCNVATLTPEPVRKNAMNIFNIPLPARTVNQHTPGGLLFLIIFQILQILHSTPRHPSASRPTAYRVLDLRFAGRYRRPFALPDSGRG